MKTQIAYVMVGGLKFRFTSDVHRGEVLDTQVEIVNADGTSFLLCAIAGCSINDFIEDFAAIIKKYEI